MKHNFLKGFVFFIISSLAIKYLAVIILGQELADKPLWPFDSLFIFIVIFLIPFAYSIISVTNKDEFLFVKEVSSGFLLGFLNHYTDNLLYTVLIFLAVSLLQSFLSALLEEMYPKLINK